MKKTAVCLLCSFLLFVAAACGGEPVPREPDPRDIASESVAYIVSTVGDGPAISIEDRELIDEFTYSVNGLRSELGEYDGDVYYPTGRYEAVGAGPWDDGYRYEGSVEFFDREGSSLALVAYCNGKVYRDRYAFPSQRSLLFDREQLDKLAREVPKGCSRVITLYYECMWGPDIILVTDIGSGRTAVITEKEQGELKEQITAHMAGLDFRVEEPCEEGAPCRFSVKWASGGTEEEYVTESVDIAQDGRIQRHGNWCSPLNGPIDMELLEQLTAPESPYLQQ